MTQIDFYILTAQARGDRFSLVCRLTEKAYQAGHRVCINTDSERDAVRINEMLWTYNDLSFIPHEVYNSNEAYSAPVLVTHKLQETDEHDILINLSAEVPGCFSQFERLLEPVDQDESSKVSGRSRYKYYRDCGYPINNHEINH